MLCTPDVFPVCMIASEQCKGCCFMLRANVNFFTTGFCTICKHLCGNMSGSLMLILGEISRADGRTCIMLIWWSWGCRKSPHCRLSLQGNWVHLSISPKEGSDVVMKWLTLFGCVPAQCVHVCGMNLKSLLNPRGLRGCACLLSHSYGNQVSGSMGINHDLSHQS